MLTQSDLQKIKNLVVTKEDLDRVGANLQDNIKEVKNDIKTVKRSVSKIEKLVDVMSRFFDRADVKLVKRVERLETHLGL